MKITSFRCELYDPNTTRQYVLSLDADREWLLETGFEDEDLEILLLREVLVERGDTFTAFLQDGRMLTIAEIGTAPTLVSHGRLETLEIRSLRIGRQM